MKNIINISKRGIIAILILCTILGVSGTSVYAATMVGETTVAIENITIETEETSIVAAEETAVVTEETTPELMPRMASRCGNKDYDGWKFSTTAYGLNRMGIPFSGSGLDITLSNPQLKISFHQCGADLCVFIDNIVTDTLMYWFKVKKW